MDLRTLPKAIAESLISEFNKIHQQFFLDHWESSQLDGGRFGEAVLRYIEYKNTGNFTPIGSQLARIAIINSVAQNTTLDRSLRITIPSLAGLIMDFRNGRNVAHLGIIDVNGMDSTFVIQAANWIMAEIIRIEVQASPTEAQKEIERIIERKVPIVEDFGGRLKILDPRLTAKNQILVVVYQKYPEIIPRESLFSWVNEKNKTRFTQYLNDLDRDKLIDYFDGNIKLTRRGLIWVEKNIKFELVV